MDEISHENPQSIAIPQTPPQPSAHVAPRTMPIGQYFGVFGALIALTLLTVALSFIELHQWHAYIGIAIAAGKAALVILFFMHVLHSHRLIWSVIIAALLWLSILMVLTLADNLTRAWLSY
jgi:cytochrome c oxidase subunit 4